MATQLVAQAPLLVTRTMKTVARRPEVLDVEGLHCCQEIVVRTLRETWGSQGGGVTSGTRAGVVRDATGQQELYAGEELRVQKTMHQWASH